VYFSFGAGDSGNQTLSPQLEVHPNQTDGVKRWVAQQSAPQTPTLQVAAAGEFLMVLSG